MSDSVQAAPSLLREAVAAYREALKENTRERVLHEWAVTQGNLGSALSLGERDMEEPDGRNVRLRAFARSAVRRNQLDSPGQTLQPERQRRAAYAERAADTDAY